MPKKRKTRKEKLHANQRNQATRPVTMSTSINDIKIPERFTFSQPNNTLTATALYPHQYLRPELTKIALLSAAIVIVESILFAILQNHIIILPNISY